MGKSVGSEGILEKTAYLAAAGTFAAAAGLIGVISYEIASGKVGKSKTERQLCKKQASQPKLECKP